MKMKHILSGICALAISATSFAQTDFSGARIDFLDAQGNRVYSQYASGDFNSLLKFSMRDNGKYDAMSKGETPISSVTVTNWGINTYPLNVNATEGVKYSIVPKGSRAVQEDQPSSLLCGTEFQLCIDIPEGAVPVLDLVYEYTSVVDGVESPVTYSFPWITMVKSLEFGANANYWFKYNGRQSCSLALTDITPYEKDETIANRYWIDFNMPNEPATIKIGLIYPDKELLDLAVKGVSQCFYTMHTETQYRNGEPGIMMETGEVISSDCIAPNLMGGSFDLFAKMPIDVANREIVSWPWQYYFTVIEHANFTLELLDRFKKCTADEIDNAKASIKALRSYAYLRLLQIYAPRWEDSYNGKAKCAPLLKTFNQEDTNLASVNDIINQCYADLSEAIEIFERTGYTKTDLILPDAAMAHATYTRLAMLKHDWQTAKIHANAARKGHHLTTNEELKGGFFIETPDWIWGGNRDIGYASYQSWWACNGPYQQLHGFGTERIDYDLYRKIPQNDIRATLFLTPENFSEIRNDWWSNNTMDDLLKFKTNVFRVIGTHLNSIKPSGASCEAGNSIEIHDGASIPEKDRKYNFGGQLKFYTGGVFNALSVDAVVFIRSAEMLLAEAEACAEMGDDASARTLLTELNSMRQEGYTCSASGKDLLDEIRLYRRIELWGEGHSWFDMKRWNLPLERRAWVAGDNTSSNHLPSMAGKVETNAANGWRYVIPAVALNYYPGIDIKEMKYDKVSGYSFVAPANQPKGIVFPADVEKARIIPQFPVTLSR